MQTSASIIPIKTIISQRKLLLPEEPGVYAFWWISPKSDLMKANRHIVLKGPGERPVDVEFLDWWPSDLAHPCLYVGKSTNIKKRFSLHIKRDSIGRLHQIPKSNEKQRAVTTSCQLRYGIEHIFPNSQDPLQIIKDNVGFSYRTNFSKNAIAERFYTEDLLIGTWKPWFNVDSER